MRRFAVISGIEVQCALGWRKKQIVELVEAAHRPHAAGEQVNAPSHFCDSRSARPPAPARLMDKMSEHRHDAGHAIS
jgi:hypothetical protein